jgi:DNA-binding HxlR family transcriptional regulator
MISAQARAPVPQGWPLPVDAATIPAAKLVGLPLRSSLGTLGRKWTLVVLRDIAFLPMPTFGDLLQRNPGMTPRVLSLRIRALLRDGIVERVSDGQDRRKVRYRLTAEGIDVVPVLVALINYAMQQQAKHAPTEFKPRAVPRTRMEHAPRPGETHDSYVPPARWA